MPYFSHDGLNFHYREAGDGVAFVFQHGLGGDVDQPFDLFTPPKGCRLVAIDCRAHGKTQPLGPHDKISITSFARDLAAFLDRLEIEQAVLGGISMGAAVALSFALQFPQRVLGLVQSRPAWLAGPNEQNATIFSYIARLLCEHGPDLGKQQFVRSPIYANVLSESPDAAASLCGQFDSPFAVERSVRLEQIPHDAAIKSLSRLSSIHIPVIVMANRQDPIHPFAMGTALAEAIPGAEFHEITPKSVCRESHADDVQRNLTHFLQHHFL